MSGLLLAVLVGGGLGALLGRFAQCRSGTCPLTANWRRGTVYGVVVGLAFHFAAGDALGPYREPKNVPPVADANFNTEVLQAGRPVVVDFFATWCGPCKILAPRLDRLAGEFGDRIKFVSVNVDRSPDLAAQFNVQGIPTLLFVGRDGKVLGANVGLISAAALRAKLESLASN